MTPNGGKFIVVLGGDGAGKSTLLRTLKSSGYCTVDWRAMQADPALAQVYGWALHSDSSEIRRQLQPVTRALDFIKFYVALYEHVIRPKLDAGQDVIVDSYYFKSFAKEILFNERVDIMGSLRHLLPLPDAIVYLHVSPEISLLRRGQRFSGHESFDGACTQSFIHFQDRLKYEINNLIRDIDRCDVAVDDKDADAVAAAVFKHFALIGIRPMNGLMEAHDAASFA
ncbi:MULTISPECIES: hypothetical protein [unclassified Deinococcus]|uniref:dTMP kinase n=1 Tax=unclassified Deinococcus TaxID=2623546 RepID=UPI000992F2F1|nr:MULTISPECIES: hypothetical protein [unclassified Deinococcus]MBX8465818.1 hypothetical protein [Deinococcus sp. RIT780]NTX99130.1 hypothetical protein [Deinococcus sp. JMULE3]